MSVEITPEPTEEERQAILLALDHDDADGSEPSPWRQLGLGIGGPAEEQDQTAWPLRQRRGAARAESAAETRRRIIDAVIDRLRKAPRGPNPFVLGEPTAVVVLTGSGLKDPDAALKNVEPPIELDGDARTLAKVLKL